MKTAPFIPLFLWHRKDGTPRSRDRNVMPKITQTKKIESSSRSEPFRSRPCDEDADNAHG